ncbi:MAG: MBL fold metallo-hydrolase [Chthoniobacteraceae bacterium]
MAQLTITFLGTGTSMGVPIIGCECAICHSPDPRDKRTRTSIYVQSPECAWAIDTGPDFRLQALREHITRMDAVVYTHSHTDHVMGLDDLRPYCFEHDLPLYASPETMADLQRIYQFAFSGLYKFPGYVRPEPHIIDGPFTLGGTKLTPIPVKHGRAQVNGYLLERNGEKLLAYLTDCKQVLGEGEALIAGAKVLIVDALRRLEHPTHMNVKEALALVDRVQPGQTYFTHICHELGHEDTQKTLPAGVLMAYDGLKIEL